MDRSVWKRVLVALTSAAGAAALAGCGAGVTEPLPPPRLPTPSAEVRPAVPSSNRPEGELTRPAGDAPVKVSSDTERDARFARFLQENSAGMIREAAVGIEKRGELRVEISRAVSPDDTLPLTRSLMAGARKDFPDLPITLSLYDPDGAPILKARFRPGEGVHYQIVHGGGTGGGAGKSAARPEPRTPTKAGDPIARGGVTERDQKFALWAEEHGRAMLRYVEADLETHGRLWFGVTRKVEPADVRPLTQSLLEGARKEFPSRDLVATVFDPEGERIGRALLQRDGSVRWEK